MGACIVDNRVYIGDFRDVIPTLMEELGGKVSLMITSPPYFVGRSYEDYISSEHEYWNLIFDMMRMTVDMLEPFGKMAINFSDRYANSKLMGKVCEISYVAPYIELSAMLDVELWARIVWDKAWVMGDCARYVAGKERFTGQMRVSPNYEYIYVWRKSGDGKPPEKEVDMTHDEWSAWASGIWRFPHAPKNVNAGGSKMAVYPAELPYRLIRMYTQPGDVVLDPCLGTGTTVRVARNLGRVGIGIEKNEKMLPTLKRHLTNDLFTNITFYESRYQ